MKIAIQSAHDCIYIVRNLQFDTIILGKKKKSKYKAFDMPDLEKRNVEAFQEKMNRARASDQIKQDKLRRHSALLDDEANLSVLGQKLAEKQPNIVVSPSDKQRRALPVIKQEKGTLLLLHYLRKILYLFLHS